MLIVEPNTIFQNSQCQTTECTKTLDPFDPNTWTESDHEFRIYGDNNAQTWAIVDEIDYLWAIKNCWCVKSCKWNKPYLRRSINTYDLMGKRLSTQSVYLHIEIMKLIRPQPNLNQCIVDHWNGNSLDNRRQNLRWVTKRENGRNRYGQAWKQERLI